VKEIASSLDFTVVAEGVETAEDQAAVRDIGVDSMQGWLFAKAIPAPDLLTQFSISPAPNFFAPTTPPAAWIEIARLHLARIHELADVTIAGVSIAGVGIARFTIAGVSTAGVRARESR